MLWELSPVDSLSLWLVVSSITFFTAMFTDQIMGDTGFGCMRNWGLIKSGVFSGLLAYNWYGYELTYQPHYTLFAATGAALVYFLTACVIKRVLFS